MKLVKTAVGRLRIMSILDGLSWLYLIYCSIYLKRICGDDTAIRIPGMVHGVLFTGYCICLYQAMMKKDWSFKTAFLIGLTSIIPFAPFWLEGWLKKQDDSSSA